MPTGSPTPTATHTRARGHARILARTGPITAAVHAVAKILCLEDGADQVAVGTLYKDMKLKPTVLKEYTENRTMAAQLGATGFMQADDGLILEDESARIRLTGRLVVDALVTGVVLAVRGVYDAQAGVMDVQEFTYAGAALLRALDCLLLADVNSPAWRTWPLEGNP